MSIGLGVGGCAGQPFCRLPSDGRGRSVRCRGAVRDASAAASPRLGPAGAEDAGAQAARGPPAAPDARHDGRPQPPRTRLRQLRGSGEPASRLPRNAAPAGPAGPPHPSPDRQPRTSRRPPAHRLRPEGRRGHQGPGREILGQPRHRHRLDDGPAAAEPGTVRLHARLQLAYDSGSGNGPFGFGWSLGLPAITRKTDKGLPLYCDGDESDVFILAGAEDLVPVLDPAGDRTDANPDGVRRTVPDRPLPPAHRRPLLPHRALDRRRTRASATGGPSPATTSPRCTAPTQRARIADPADPTQIFSWQICRTWDDKGNAAIYSYTAEDSAGIDLAAAHEANRTPRPRRADLPQDRPVREPPAVLPRLDRAAGDAAPRRLDVLAWSSTTATTPPCPRRRNPTSPGRCAPTRSPPIAPDSRSGPTGGSSGSCSSTTSRPSRRPAPDCLVRSLDLAYSDQQAPADPRNPIYTFLASVTQTGYRPAGDGASPAGRCRRSSSSYSQPQIQPDVLTLDPDSQANLPEGLDGSSFQWADLDGEGLSGILSDAGGAWYYKRNLSAGQPGRAARRDGRGPGQLRPAGDRRRTCRPASDLAGVRLLDLSGSGRLDVVDLAGPDPGSSSGREDATFEPLQRFAALPALDWSDPNVTFIDVTGDGLADILMTEDGLFTVYASLGGDAGFDAAAAGAAGLGRGKRPQRRARRRHRRPSSPPTCRGTASSDIVRVRNGEACYWPNTGYGRFGAKVTMDLAPRFDNEERFDPRRIRLADIDGSGTADLLYVGEDGVTAWFNQSGNAWSAPTRIAVFPAADRLSTVQVIDLLGTGTACLVWSSPLPGETAAPLLYVDLMGGQKPHLMTGARNNLGAETRVSYAPSTRFYVADETAGHPWVTRLPFPVQVVERTETIDWIGRNRLVTPLRLPSRLLRRLRARVPRVRHGRAVGHRGVPRPTPPSTTATDSSTGTSSPGRRRCSPAPGSTPARSPTPRPSPSST